MPLDWETGIKSIKFWGIELNYIVWTLVAEYRYLNIWLAVRGCKVSVYPPVIAHAGTQVARYTPTYH